MARIPVLRQRSTLFATLPEDLDDVAAQELLAQILAEVQKHQTKGVIVDMSALDIVDSFLGRIIADVANCTSVLDARTIVCGLQPSVAITLVELGMEFPKVAFAMNIEQAMDAMDAT